MKAALPIRGASPRVATIPVEVERSTGRVPNSIVEQSLGALRTVLSVMADMITIKVAPLDELQARTQVVW